MDKNINRQRRFLMGGAFALAGLSALELTFGPTARAATLPAGAGKGLGPIRQVRTAELDIGYAELGPANGKPVILLHGWPYDIHSFEEVAPILAAQGYRVLVPYLRGSGSTRFLKEDAFRNAQQTAVALDIIAMMDALGIRDAIFGAFDWGARTACIIAALFPERVQGLVSVSGYLIGTPAGNRMPLPPKAEYDWWYQYYFTTERGRLGYEANRKEFNRLIWKTASPQWNFDEATYARSAASFDNPDHVAIVIHNYRWRLGLADGERKYDALEARLADGPAISVPTITMEGDANGAPHAPPAAYAAKFSGKYQHRTLKGGIGHNLPQEAPRDFAQAILDVAAMR